MTASELVRRLRQACASGQAQLEVEVWVEEARYQVFSLVYEPTTRCLVVIAQPRDAAGHPEGG
jgi:hypothetical protein